MVVGVYVISLASFHVLTSIKAGIPRYEQYRWSPQLYCLVSLSFFICIIISLRPAWLARVLLCYKHTQSSGNDDVDERQHTPLV